MLKFGVFYTHPPSPIGASFGVQEYANDLCLHAKFHLDRVIVSPLRGKTKFGCIFKFNVQHWMGLHHYKSSPMQWYQDSLWVQLA